MTDMIQQIEEILTNKKAFESMSDLFNTYSTDGGKSIPELKFPNLLIEIGDQYGISDVTIDDVKAHEDDEDSSGHKGGEPTMPVAVFKKLSPAILKAIKAKLQE